MESYTGNIPAQSTVNLFSGRHDRLRQCPPIGRPSRHRVLDFSFVKGCNPGVLTHGACPIPPWKRRAELLTFNSGRSCHADKTLPRWSERLRAAVAFLLVFAGVTTWILGPHHRKAHKRSDDRPAVWGQLDRMPRKPEGPVPTAGGKAVRIDSTNAPTEP
jgi:hypothetical protein